MHIASPYALFALLLIPIVVILEVIRARRRQVVVPSLFLWRKVLELRTEVRGKRPQMIRIIETILRVLCISSVVFALAGPYVESKVDAPVNVVCVLDTSASMKALRSDGRSRWQVGIEALKSELGQMGEVEKVEFVFSTPVEMENIGKLGRDEALHFLANVKPTDVAGDFEKALCQAMMLVHQSSDTVVIGVTDNLPAGLEMGYSGVGRDNGDDIRNPTDKGVGGAGTDMGQIEWKTLERVKVISVGEPVCNMAITAFDVQEIPDDGKLILYVAVENFSDVSRDVSVEVRSLWNEAILAGTTVNIDGEDRKGVVFELPHFERYDVFFARIEAEDALVTDDVAYAVRREGRPLRVCLIGKEDGSIRRVLDAFGDVEVVVSSSASEGADFYVFSGTLPSELPDADAMFVAPSRALHEPVVPPVGFPLVIRGELENITGAVVTDHEGLMRHVDFDGVWIGKALAAEPREGYFKTLVWCEKWSLIGVWSDGRRERLYIGFDLSSFGRSRNTNWPLKPSFVCFWGNLLKRVMERAGGGPGGYGYVHAGDRIFLPVDDGSQKGVVRLRGIEETRPYEITWSEGESRVVFVPLNVGMYEFESVGKPKQFAANLLNVEESNTRLACEGEIGRWEESVSASRTRRYPLEKLFIVLSVLLLILLWWVGRGNS